MKRALNSGAGASSSSATFADGVTVRTHKRVRETMGIGLSNASDHLTDMTITIPTPTGMLTTLFEDHGERLELRESWNPINLVEDESTARVMCHSSVQQSIGERPIEHIIVGCAINAEVHGYRKLLLGKQRTGHIFVEEESLPVVRCHTGIVRSMCLSPYGSRHNWLLTGSMDKTVVETNVLTGAIVMTIRTPSPVFSCAYATKDTRCRYVYVGGADGVLRVYDCAQLRRGKAAATDGEYTTPHLEIREPTVRGGIFEVLSVTQTYQYNKRGSPRESDIQHPVINGILVMRVDSVRFYTVNDAFDKYQSRFQGRPKAISWNYERLLVTLRPFGDQTEVEHQMHRIDMVNANGRRTYSSTKMETAQFPGDQTTLTRTSFCGIGFDYYVVETCEEGSILHKMGGRQRMAQFCLSLAPTEPVYHLVEVEADTCFVLGGGKLSCFFFQVNP